MTIDEDKALWTERAMERFHRAMAEWDEVALNGPSPGYKGPKIDGPNPGKRGQYLLNEILLMAGIGGSANLSVWYALRAVRALIDAGKPYPALDLMAHLRPMTREQVAEYHYHKSLAYRDAKRFDLARQHLLLSGPGDREDRAGIILDLLTQNPNLKARAGAYLADYQPGTSPHSPSSHPSRYGPTEGGRESDPSGTRRWPTRLQTELRWLWTFGHIPNPEVEEGLGILAGLHPHLKWLGTGPHDLHYLHWGWID